MIAEEVATKALRLKPIEKIHLVEMLLDSLDHPDESIQQKWVEESEKRFSAYKNGLVDSISLEEIRTRMES